MELYEHKLAFAKEMAERAGLAGYVDFRVGDAVEMIAALSSKVDFVLLDLYKNLYVPCLEVARSPDDRMGDCCALRPDGDACRHRSLIAMAYCVRRMDAAARDLRAQQDAGIRLGRVGLDVVGVRACHYF
jgi:hypothetical protein